ncbi:MAG: cytochrome c-type biogenesis protein CcmH [Gemmatimonadaceae bacterium]
MISRRAWLRGGASALATGAALLVIVRELESQEQVTRIVDTSNLFPMDQSAARSVRLPSKPGARPSMTPLERDALEHRIRCQCGCTLDVFTCRTTDFSCQVSPSMHRDVMALVEGGYTAEEILDAFVNVYGERVLMAPTREGFNLLGYVVPGIAIGIGAIVLAVMIRRWRRPVAAGASPPSVSQIDASPDELARLDAAIRDDS